MIATLKKKLSILILGASGLLGKIILEKLSTNFNIKGTTHRKNKIKKFIKLTIKKLIGS